MTNQIELKDSDGRLALPNGEILICWYDAGDVDTIETKAPNKETLISALFGAREMGEVPSSTDSAKLPNGEVIDF